MKGKYSKLSFVYLIFFSICISCNKEQCQKFDYEKMKCDTTKMFYAQIFINNHDTLVFQPDYFGMENQEESVPSFQTMDECRNGFEISYNCLQNNFRYNLYFHVYPMNKYVCVYSFPNNIEMRYEGCNSKADINDNVVFNNEDMKIKHFVKSIELVKGEIINIVDTNNVSWRRIYRYDRKYFNSNIERNLWR
jgi:hypothetical protein